jgi:hypothetical protein
MGWGGHMYIAHRCIIGQVARSRCGLRAGLSALQRAVVQLGLCAIRAEVLSCLYAFSSQTPPEFVCRVMHAQRKTTFVGRWRREPDLY